MQHKESMFLVNSANNWIKEVKDLPIPNMLFSEFWYENELCILFADTNVGKTILAVQIANSISKGIPIKNFKLEGDKQQVLYFDFELTAKQFQIRYTANDFPDDHPNKYYNFDNNFKRVELNSDYIFESGQRVDYIINWIEHTIIQTDAKVLVIDNLTYLRDEIENSKNAAPLMKELKELKKKHSLSILVIAHTPKRDLSKPITLNDLAGSKQLMNFTDSCFAINKSFKDENLRYIKQIKARNTEVLYGLDNVILCNKVKHSNILEFVFNDFSSELDHLRELTIEDKDYRVQEAFRMKNEGMNNVQIGKQLGVSEGAVRKWLKKAA
jgi:hypothetical protein